MLYKLKFYVDVTDEYDKIFNLFKRQNVTMEYWSSIAPPAHAVFILEGISAVGMANWIQRLIKVGAKFRYTADQCIYVNAEGNKND